MDYGLKKWIKSQCLTLDFGSGHDLTVREFEPHFRLCADSVEPAWDSRSPSLSAPPMLVLSLSLKISKLNKNKRKIEMALPTFPLPSCAFVYVCVCVSQIIRRNCKRCWTASLSCFPILLRAQTGLLHVTSCSPGIGSSCTLLCPTQHRKEKAVWPGAFFHGPDPVQGEGL